MKKSEFKKSIYRFSVILFLIVCLNNSCSDSNQRENENADETETVGSEPGNTGDYQEPEEYVTEEAAEVNTSETSEEITRDPAGDLNPGDTGHGTEEQNQTDDKDVRNSLSDYTVSLSADQELELQETGEFTVWIGRDEYLPETGAEKISDKTTIPTEIGQFAKITPYAPDFEVEPLEYKCIAIHPSGSGVRFKFKPRKKGTFKISANIELYKEENCGGTPVPKTTKTLSVKVDVDGRVILREKIKELLAVVWEKFLSFWGILLTTLFGAAIIFIRGKLKGKSNDLQ